MNTPTVTSPARSDGPHGTSGVEQPAAPSQPVRVSTARDVFAPEKPRGPRLIRELPHPRAVEKLAEIAAHAKGAAQGILKAAAAAAARTARPSLLEVVLTDRSEGRDKALAEIREPVTGVLKREIVVRPDGDVIVRARFRPHQAVGETDLKVPGATWIDLPTRDFAGIPNGAVIELSTARQKKGRDSSWKLEFDRSHAHPVVNMVGTVVEEGDKLYVAASTDLSPLKRLELKSSAPARELVGKTVVVDVKDGLGAKPYGILHDILDETDTLRVRQMRAAADCGIAIAFPSAVLAESQALENARPDFGPRPGIVDMSDKAWTSTDNPGSQSDYRSVDPEQASYIEKRPDGGWTVYDALTYRRSFVARDSATEAHAAIQQFTVYADGADAPAFPSTVSEDLAVFIQGKPRYAKVVKTVYDASGTLLEGNTEVFLARIVNQWQGSYREAERYFVDPSKVDLTPAVREQLDLGRALLEARATAKGSGARHDGRYRAELLRELFSISGNKEVGRLIKSMGGVSVHRHHPEASTGRLAGFQEFAEAMGVPWGDALDLVGYVDKLDPADPRSEVLALQAMRTMAWAYFSTTESGHAGLQAEDYDQVTAANRRGPDIVNLEQGAAASEAKTSGTAPTWPWTEKQAKRIEDQANARQALVKRDVDDYFVGLRAAEALKDFVGQTVSAKLIDIRPSGLTFAVTGMNVRVKVGLRKVADTFGEYFDVIKGGARLESQGGTHVFDAAKTYTLHIHGVDRELGVVKAVPTSAAPVAVAGAPAPFALRIE